MSTDHESRFDDDPALREALKRCSPATYYAACKFKQRGRSDDLRTVVHGVVERFVERELRPKLAAGGEGLRLREDLAIDSLTMMEIVMIAEEVLQITASNDELMHLKTVGDVHAFVLAKTRETKFPTGRSKANGEATWNLNAVSEEVRRLESGGSPPAKATS